MVTLRDVQEAGRRFYFFINNGRIMCEDKRTGEIVYVAQATEDYNCG